MRRWLLIAAAAASLLLTACDDGGPQAEAPPPVAPTRDAVTHFGGMMLLDHAGPRAQIHLTGGEVLWFPAVSDAVAFTLLPEESKAIAAIYVSDMATAQGWAEPDTWVLHDAALYVIDSEARGGMAMPEAVPFSARPAAEAFVARHGGRIVGWADIPPDYVLRAPEDDAPMPMHSHGERHGALGEPTIFDLLGEDPVTCLTLAGEVAATPAAATAATEVSQ